MPSSPREYTPELSSGYLATLMNQIEQQGAADEGRAVSEAAGRGLLGQAEGGALVGSARAGTSATRASTLANFDLNLADRSRDERLWNEHTEETQHFQDYERKKSEGFAREMANMGYAFQDSEQGKARTAAEQGQEMGIVSGALSSGVGGYFGGLGKAAGAAATTAA